jgi:hypothetical protein
MRMSDLKTLTPNRTKTKQLEKNAVVIMLESIFQNTENHLVSLLYHNKSKVVSIELQKASKLGCSEVVTFGACEMGS